MNRYSFTHYNRCKAFYIKLFYQNFFKKILAQLRKQNYTGSKENSDKPMLVHRSFCVL